MSDNEIWIVEFQFIWIWINLFLIKCVDRIICGDKEFYFFFVGNLFVLNLERVVNFFDNDLGGNCLCMGMLLC